VLTSVCMWVVYRIESPRKGKANSRSGERQA
jgi:hypothetical protein